MPPRRDFITQQKKQIDAELERLRPAHEEYLTLLKVREALEGVSVQTADGRRTSGRTAQGRIAARPGRPARADRRRRGRPPKGTPTRADETLALIKANPGITVAEIAKQMDIRQNYLYRVTGQLQKQGRVKRRNGGFHAA
jgi:hypothetical protein